MFHDRLLQVYVNAFRIKSLPIRQFEQGLKYIAADLGIGRPPRHAEVVATARNLTSLLLSSDFGDDWLLLNTGSCFMTDSCKCM